MILWPDVEDRAGTISWNWNQRTRQIPLLGFTVRRVIILGRHKLEPFDLTSRYHHHSEISVADARPVNSSGKLLPVWTALVFVNRASCVTLNLISDRRDCFRRYRVKVVVFYAL